MRGFLQVSPLVLALVAFGATAWASEGSSESGVYDDRIIFGQSAALKGPAAALGSGMREGILAAFEEANSDGGVHGRRIELISYNDGYEPETAIANTQKLIEEDEVFALIGEVGTPTSKAVQPIATAQGVPFLGPFTGAAFLRDSQLENVINVRASYDQETEAWIKHLTEDLGFSRIAILYQDDSFGRAGLAGVEAALERRQMPLVAEGTYMRNTTAVKRALLTIRNADPEAVVIVGAYKPSATFILLARSIGLDPVFVNISFVGSKALDEGFEPGFVSLEGYLVGRLVVSALDEVGRDVTRAGLLDTIRSVGIFDLGGIRLSYGEDDNQGMDQVFLTVIEADGSFKAVEALSVD